MNKAIEQQQNFYKYLNIIRIGNKNDNQKKVLANANILFNGRNSAVKFIEDYGSMILEAKRLAKEEQEGKGLKILTPNQMLKRLPIALVKPGNNSDSLSNEIRQIAYSLYQSKEITKKVYNNIISSIMLELTNKLNLRRGQKTFALSNLSIYYTWKNVKSSYNNNKFKISAPAWSEEFELPDGSYSASDIQDYFEYILKKHGESADIPSIRIYVNKIENRITFKIKSGCYLEHLTPETMKLLGSAENKINKDKNGENVPHSEIAEIVVVHCNLVNNDCQQNSRILYTFVPNKTFGSLLKI